MKTPESRQARSGVEGEQQLSASSVLSHARRQLSPQRNAFNWFLDAATYTKDENYEDALIAGRRGIRALRKMVTR